MATADDNADRFEAVVGARRGAGDAVPDADEPVRQGNADPQPVPLVDQVTTNLMVAYFVSGGIAAIQLFT